MKAVTELLFYYTTMPKQDSTSPNMCAFILGLRFCKEFNLVSIPCTCTTKCIHGAQPCGRHTLHYESEADSVKLRTKWNKHLPLRKKIGDPLEDLKQTFPEAFDSQVVLFEDEVSLKLSPDVKPVVTTQSYTTKHYATAKERA